MVILTDNQLSLNVLLFSFNPIGQICLGGPPVTAVALQKGSEEGLTKDP